jgi:hypothetical protein
MIQASEETGGVNVLQVMKAWLINVQASTIHHLGRGNFMVAGETVKLRSKMK